MIITKDFNIKLFLALCLCFIFFTVIGTLSHEFGHYIVARLLGYNAFINYGYTYWSAPQDFDGVTQYRDWGLITLGGPAQTILTGTIGFILLFRRKTNINLNDKLDLTQWFFIFLALFWLRELFNFVTGMLSGFSRRGDEENLARKWDLPSLSFILPLAIVAFLVLTYIYFWFIPYKQRLTFLSAGLFGGLLGFYLWLLKLGPILMP